MELRGILTVVRYSACNCVVKGSVEPVQSDQRIVGRNIRIDQPGPIFFFLPTRRWLARIGKLHFTGASIQRIVHNKFSERK